MNTRWSDAFTTHRNKLSVHVEASTRCNSRCVLCPRFVATSTITDPKLNLDEITIDEFKAWFPTELFSNMYYFNFCGNYGDPIACTDLAEIIEYLVANDAPKITIRTNGGVRNKKFWHKLGTLLQSKERHIVWSVDGMEDTNHLYRREVKWKNIQNNLMTFIAAGGYAQQEFLVFKHNEHQIDEAKVHAKSLGIKRIDFKAAVGFANDLDKTYNPKPARDKNLNVTHVLEHAERYRSPDYTDVMFDGIPLTPSDYRRHWEDETVKLRHYLNTVNTDKELPLQVEKLDIYRSVEDNKIDCKVHINKGSENYREVFLNPDGEVTPCCYMGQITSDHSNQDLITKEALKPYSELNLNTNSLSNIISILDRKVADKWNKKHSEGRSTTCSMTCGVRDNNQMSKIYRESEEAQKQNLL